MMKNVLDARSRACWARPVLTQLDVSSTLNSPPCANAENVNQSGNANMPGLCTS